MEGKRQKLYIGGAHCGRAYALAVAHEMFKLQGLHLVEYPKKDNEVGLDLTEIELDTNRGVMPISYKMEVGKHDVKSASASFRREPKQKWYNQFQNKRKRK